MKNNNNSNTHLPDWQQGEHSTLSPMERIELMNEWLKQNKLSIINIISFDDDTDETVVGFIDV